MRGADVGGRKRDRRGHGKGGKRGKSKERRTFCILVSTFFFGNFPYF
jgi:hypothetical protein